MKGTSMRGDWWRALVAGCAVLAFGTLCHAANSETPVSTTGKYDSQVAAPDKLTTTDGNKSLTVTGGDAAPDRPLDQGKVRHTAMDGATITFDGRSTGWGCTFTVKGVYVIEAANAAEVRSARRNKEKNKWTSTFEEEDNARLVLEINEDGPADDVVLMGNSGGRLKIWILDTTGSHTVTLAADLADKLSGLPETVSVAAGNTPTEVVLNGAASGQVTITANTTIDNKGLSSQVTAKVLGFKGKVVPKDDFPGRSFQKLGLLETGDLQVELAAGTDLTDLTPLAWAKTSGSMEVRRIVREAGTAEFTAGPTPSTVSLTLTDKHGNSIHIDIAVIPPNGGLCKQRPGTKVWHSEKNEGRNFSIGVRSDFYLTPVDVSFSQIWFKEGDCVGEPTGWFKKERFATVGHNANIQGWEWMRVAKPEDGVPGSKVLFTDPTFDTAAFGRIPPNKFPYEDGSTFNWPIPWLYSTERQESKQICIMNQTATVDEDGNATITKGDAKGKNRHGDPGQDY